MKLVLTLLGFGILVAGDKLPNAYFAPPSNALSAAGGYYIPASTTPAPIPQNYIPPPSYQGPSAVYIGYGHSSTTPTPPIAQYQQQQQQQPIYQRPQIQQYQQYQNRYDSGAYHQYSHSGLSTNPILRLENVNNGDGNYRFDYLTANGISHNEEGHLHNPGTNQEENVVRGSYSYPGPDGKVYTVNYWADASGFHASGDHLPTPPPIPEAIQRSLASRQNQSGQYQQGYQPQQQYYTPSGQYNRGYY